MCNLKQILVCIAWSKIVILYDRSIVENQPITERLSQMFLNWACMYCNDVSIFTSVNYKYMYQWHRLIQGRESPNCCRFCLLIYNKSHLCISVISSFGKSYNYTFVHKVNTGWESSLSSDSILHHAIKIWLAYVHSNHYLS